jgi:hypothetical protein
MNTKTFFRAALLLFVAACIFVFFRGQLGHKPGHAAQSASNTDTASSLNAQDARSLPANTRVVAYFFHGYRQCPSCRHLESVSQNAIAEDFPDALKSGMVQWRAVNIEDPANRHFASEYQVYWSSLVLVKVRTGRPVAYKNLEQAWQIQQDDKALRSYVQAEVRAYLGAN